MASLGSKDCFKDIQVTLRLRMVQYTHDNNVMQNLDFGTSGLAQIMQQTLEVERVTFDGMNCKPHHENSNSNSLACGDGSIQATSRAYTYMEVEISNIANWSYHDNESANQVNSTQQDIENIIRSFDQKLVAN